MKTIPGRVVADGDGGFGADDDGTGATSSV
jgi:hypothetical protein